MGGGVDPKIVKGWTYRQLKKIEAHLKRVEGIDCRYKNWEVQGDNFRIYVASIGPASNGEKFFYIVLIFEPGNGEKAEVYSDCSVAKGCVGAMAKGYQRIKEYRSVTA